MRAGNQNINGGLLKLTIRSRKTGTKNHMRSIATKNGGIALLCRTRWSPISYDIKSGFILYDVILSRYDFSFVRCIQISHIKCRSA